MAADDRAATLALMSQAANDVAAPAPPDAHALLEGLRDHPDAFDFYQALRRIEHAYRGWPRLGAAARPIDEPVRFGQAVSLTAAAASLTAFVPADGARPARLYNAFFGVLGPNGPLPLHLTEYAKQRAHHRSDRALVAFLDLFHHRLLSLFYRAHSSADPATQHDRPDADRFAAYVASMMGLGLSSLRPRDDVKLYYAGLFAAQTKNAAGLRALLEDYLQVRVRIEELVGEWATLPAAQAWKLGEAGQRSRAQMGRLASTALVGTRVWLRQHRFRIALGPLRHAQFQELLPGTPLYLAVVALVRSYVGDELKWDLRLTLAHDAIQPARLGSHAQLGRTSWLVARKPNAPRNKDHEDLIVDPEQDYARSIDTRRSPAARG